MLAILAAGYGLLALLANEYTLAWAFGVPELGRELRISLAWFDATLLLLALLAFFGRRRLAIVQLNIAVAAVVASIATVECVLRIREVPESDVLVANAELRQMHPTLHHALVENVESFSKWGGAIVPYATNDLGFRDRVVRQVPKNPVGAQRVLILGDSFAEGIGVEFEDSFASRLQQLLQRSGTNTEVLTAGVVSYSPRLEYRQLRGFLDGGYHTDVVVLLLDISDVHDEGKEYADWDGYSTADRAEKRSEQQREIAAARREERRPENVLIPRLLQRLERDDTRLAPRYERVPRFLWTEKDELRALPWVDAGIGICSDYVGRIATLCAEQKIAFYLVIYPHPTQLSGEHCLDSEYRTIFRDFASRRGIALIDLFSTFCELADWRDYFIDRDIHWNPRGHALVAARLHDRLRNAVGRDDS